MVARGSEVRPGTRIDGDEAPEVIGVEPREPHDLDEVFREVAERASRYARDIAVVGR